MSAPRITEIPPNTTAEFIEALASTTYTQAQQAGGSIPYTAIREVSENFIHAQFREIIVSILDHGNTIRFSDQGPGIPHKEKAQMPGFSSATEPMKRYIRGVGSGLPLVKEYLSFKHGRITIEDNLKSGAVVTISVSPEEEDRRPISQKKRGVIIPALTDREKDVLFLFMQEHTLRLTDIKDELGLSPSTVHRILGKLEEQGIIESAGKMRVLTDFGSQVANQLF
ncbi:histidine kinase [Slackia equolifaciens]|uniref:Histidine kinase n=2 Tax=Slackia equolifaciens TaxID=498718 RepID=A0A3N0AT31_9ACTN|nr:histidine kinase [Slackia equolifaciens]